MNDDKVFSDVTLSIPVGLIKKGGYSTVSNVLMSNLGFLIHLLGALTIFFETFVLQVFILKFFFQYHLSSNYNLNVTGVT